MKDKSKLRFGCKSCDYWPFRDEKQSKANWNVFKVENCPKCGKPMAIDFEYIVKKSK